jgi:hypothetical protein
MKSILISFVLLLPFNERQCTRMGKPPALPPCIQARIDSIRKQPVWNPPAEVYAYEYRGKTVYGFSADCCDFFNVVVDGDCNYICAPSGGITGKGDRQCPDFADSARQIRLVWRDDRK